MQGFRDETVVLPDAVWSWQPSAVVGVGGQPARPQVPRMLVYEGLSRPNGCALSPDETVLYVTDTGKALGDNVSASIYAYDLSYDPEDATPLLSNKRLFYYAGNGVRPNGDGYICGGSLLYPMTPGVTLTWYGTGGRNCVCVVFSLLGS
jgi:hypothetical protein